MSSQETTSLHSARPGGRECSLLHHSSSHRGRNRSKPKIAKGIYHLAWLLSAGTENLRVQTQHYQLRARKKNWPVWMASKTCPTNFLAASWVSAAARRRAAGSSTTHPTHLELELVRSKSILFWIRTWWLLDNTSNTSWNNTQHYNQRRCRPRQPWGMWLTLCVYCSKMMWLHLQYTPGVWMNPVAATDYI